MICRKEAVVESWGQIIGRLRIYGGAGQVVWAIPNSGPRVSV